jgi:hypothetical protein
MTRALDVPKLAFAYRRLVLWFGAQLIVGFGRVAVLGAGVDNPALSLAVLAVTLVTIGALAYYGYLTATALGSDVGWLWGVAMFVPCVNVITLLLLSSKATTACRAAGIKVGFFGPKTMARGGDTNG